MKSFFQRPSPSRIRRIGIEIGVAYALCLLFLVLAEPHLLFLPMDGPTEPAAAGLTNFTRQTLPDGSNTLVYWESSATPDAPTLLYFHGNGGGLYMFTPALDYFAKHGFHVIAMEYPGYPGDPGEPSESLITHQATRLFDHVASTQPNHPIILWGYSLGSGVATQLAAIRKPATLILEAPFTAAVDRAGELFPIFPTKMLMRNQFRSRDAIANVHAPVFIMHGTDDRVIPIHHGRDLFALAHEPKSMKEYQGYGHLNLLDSNAYADALTFIHAHQP